MIRLFFDGIYNKFAGIVNVLVLSSFSLDYIGLIFFKELGLLPLCTLLFKSDFNAPNNDI